MGQMKRRFYILGLSLLVLVIALAGLLAALEVLPKSTTSAVQNPGGTGVGTPTPDPNNDKPPITTPPKPINLTPDINLSPDFSISLPKSFNFDVSKSTNPGLSLKSEPPPHLPLLKVTGAQNTEYLKSITSSYYDGTAWLQVNTSGYVPYNGEKLTLPNLKPSQTVTDDVTVNTIADIAAGNEALPTSLYPVSVNGSEPLLFSPESGTFLSTQDFPTEYSFETTHYVFSRQALANAQIDPAAEYLQLPDNITQRTLQLAKDITSGIKSPYLQAKAIEDYLKTNYAYDFNAEPAPAGQEPNDWFLFQEKSGVCTNFNSAFVILSRAAGIPARMAGGFRISPHDEAQAVYADQAHAWAEVKFKELGWQTFDATGSISSVPLLNTVTKITTIGATATKGKEFTVAGTVRTDSLKPVEGTMVEILVNTTKDAKGATLVGQGIVSQGHFEIKAVIPGEMAVGNYQVIAHNLKSPQYAESWSDPAIKVVSATAIKLDLPASIKQGEKITVNGLLSGEFGEALGGAAVKISMDGGTAASTLTDKDGRFTWQTAVNEPGKYTLSASFAGTEYFLATSKEADFRVLAPAVIELKTSGDTAGKPVTVSGSLKEKTTNNPLPGRTLPVSIDKVKNEIQPAADDKGYFSFKYTFKDAGAHHIEVMFNGDTEYFETSAAADIDIKAAPVFSLWPVIIAVLALAAAGTGGWYLYRRMKNRPAGPSPAAGQATPETQVLTPWQSASPGLTLTIDLPQIKPPFPDMWGVGEELKITFRLANETGTGITSPIDISMDGETTSKLDTGKDGLAEMPYIYPAKGQYNITANYYSETPDKKASAARPVRIVDYREEIVSIFSEMLEEFRGLGVAISDEYTPRKIQYLVLSAKTDIPEQALEDVITCFEETDYSLHPITRGHYETMYLAQMEIKKHGNRPAAAARR
jgi:transglutaminase-like putative cysteine protease